MFSVIIVPIFSLTAIKLKIPIRIFLTASALIVLSPHTSTTGVVTTVSF